MVSFRRRVRIAGGRFWCAACNSVNRTCKLQHVYFIYCNSRGGYRERVRYGKSRPNYVSLIYGNICLLFQRASFPYQVRKLWIWR